MWRGSKLTVCALLTLLAWRSIFGSYDLWSALLPTAYAREVEATHEWTLLGENDTVAAGMHIRIDIQTGEKWVKLPDTDVSDDNNKNQRHKSTAQLMADGALVLVESSNDDAGKDDKDNDSSKKDDPQLDFEMMYRTLAQLPEAEKQEMKLPELPGGKVSSLSGGERQAFEGRMKQIWERRQEQLRKFAEEYLADMPEILKDRIERIHTYLADPVSQLQSLDMEIKNDGMVTHVVSVLQDLEYHLSDVDMARDFFTMGGWPLLLSLISNDAHGSKAAASENNATLTTDLLDKRSIVQAHAAWALGTSVKNVGEFTPFAIAKVALVGRHGGHGKVTTAVELLLDQYVAATSTPLHRDESLEIRNLLTGKLLYALGCLLRANRPAQVRFAAAGGPAVLGRHLAKTLREPFTTSAGKVMERLLTLADDIISDAKLHPGKDEGVDAAIIQGFATPKWCNAVLDALKQVGSRGNNHPFMLQEKVLQTVQTFMSECKTTWEPSTVQEAILGLRATWEDTATGRDPDVHKEVVGAIDSFLEIFELTGEK